MLADGAGRLTVNFLMRDDDPIDREIVQAAIHPRFQKGKPKFQGEGRYRPGTGGGRGPIPSVLTRLRQRREDAAVSAGLPDWPVNSADSAGELKKFR